jgi:hypothetical protein
MQADMHLSANSHNIKSCSETDLRAAMVSSEAQSPLNKQTEKYGVQNYEIIKCKPHIISIKHIILGCKEVKNFSVSMNVSTKVTA